MRLAHKLSLAQIALIGAVLTVHAGIRLRREINLFENDMRRDQHEIGAAMAAATQEVWESAGRNRALRLVREADSGGESVDIRFVAFPDSAGSAVKPASLRPSGHIMTVKHKGPGPGTASTFTPIQVDGRAVGGVMVSESLAEERQFVHATIVHMVVTTTALAAGAILISILFGASVVVRPMEELADQARRIGTGDLTRRLGRRNRDEIGELADEMNVMCDRLEEAATRVASESSARINALEQLRHADRLATIGTLSSGIAHELGTPLNVVSGRARMIETGAVADHESVECARIIREQAERMAGTIRQLLDFSRRGGHIKVKAALYSLADQVLVMLKPYAEKRGVQIRLIEETCGQELVYVDVEQIRQVITNLTLNGIQAMPSGGVLSLGVFHAQRRSPAEEFGRGEEEPARAEDCVCLQITDEGNGIPEELLERIFDPFFTTKRVGEGTGLGLSVSYGIVQEHGGWIEVESKPGQGSRFRVCLPVQDEPRVDMAARG